MPRHSNGGAAARCAVLSIAAVWLPAGPTVAGVPPGGGARPAADPGGIRRPGADRGAGHVATSSD